MITHEHLLTFPSKAAHVLFQRLWLKYWQSACVLVLSEDGANDSDHRGTDVSEVGSTLALISQ